MGCDRLARDREGLRPLGQGKGARQRGRRVSTARRRRRRRQLRRAYGGRRPRCELPSLGLTPRAREWSETLCQSELQVLRKSELGICGTHTGAGGGRHGERTGISKVDRGSQGRAGCPLEARGARTFLEEPPPRPPACPAARAAAEAVPRRRGGDGHGGFAAGCRGGGRNQAAVLTFPCLGLKLKGSPPISCIFSC